MTVKLFTSESLVGIWLYPEAHVSRRVLQCTTSAMPELDYYKRVNYKYMKFK